MKTVMYANQHKHLKADPTTHRYHIQSPTTSVILQGEKVILWTDSQPNSCQNRNRKKKGQTNNQIYLLYFPFPIRSHNMAYGYNPLFQPSRLLYIIKSPMLSILFFFKLHRMKTCSPIITRALSSKPVLSRFINLAKMKGVPFSTKCYHFQIRHVNMSSRE